MMGNFKCFNYMDILQSTLLCFSVLTTSLASVIPSPIGSVSSGTSYYQCQPLDRTMNSSLRVTLPLQSCHIFESQDGVKYITCFKVPPNTLRPDDVIGNVPSIESVLRGDSNESYDLEVVSLSSNQDSARRYDITDLGDPDLFHGWADVQGRGAANDYCRVVGKTKRRFLSCHLAGSTNQGHHYVSKLGFDIGYPGTWFMRDMNDDGRDDYCRCVGPTTNSKMTCMKAGEKGFSGSPMQIGSQHSLVLTSSSGCHKRRVNAMFGE